MAVPRRLKRVLLFFVAVVVTGLALSLSMPYLMMWAVRVSPDKLLEIYFPEVDRSTVQFQYIEARHWMDTHAVAVFTTTKPFALKRYFPEECGERDRAWNSSYFPPDKQPPAGARCSLKRKPDDAVWRFSVQYENADYGPFYIYILD